jgi:hypothetical protein
VWWRDRFLLIARVAGRRVKIIGNGSVELLIKGFFRLSRFRDVRKILRPFLRRE